MRSVNANPGKYVSIITNFGCHYTCPECIVRNNGLKMSETDNFSTQEPLNKVLCKERPEWVSVSGGGDPLFHWKDHWSFYEGLFHTAERRNVKLEMHTSYLPDSPEVQDFPLNWFERVVYHVHKFDDLLHVKRKFGEIVRVVFVVDDNMTEQDVLAMVTASPLSTASTDLLEPPRAAAPFYMSIGNRPRPVQARKCPPKENEQKGAENGKVQYHAVRH